MAENLLKSLKFPGIANPYMIPAPFTATDENNDGNIKFTSFPGENGEGGGGAIILDTSLTLSGYAADAKAVGDRLNSFKQIITHNSTSELPAVVEGAILIAYDE